MNSILDHGALLRLERGRVKRAAQSVLDELRRDILSGSLRVMPSLDECALRVAAKVTEDDKPRLRKLINATGIVLHTNLGRAPLGADICAKAIEVCAGYCNLEYNTRTGARGSRYSHVEDIICELTGAEAAMAVNNNAAATFLMLAACAGGRKVAVSRGELVEVGGAFRIPEIMESSGAALVEVGTTNRTRLSDYASAVNDKGAEALLKVHTSNYEIVGFTESVSVSELAALGRETGVPVLYDMGSCFLVEPERLGLSCGKTAKDGIAEGADIICFSGDKLMGSAQAGIIAGRADLIALMKRHPFARVVRPDKLCLAVLEAALRIYRFPQEAAAGIPVLAMLSQRPEELKERSESFAARIIACFHDVAAEVRETADEAGGGSLPNVRLKSWAVALEARGLSANDLERGLREADVPVIIRINDGKALISLRTVPAEDEAVLLDALREVLSGFAAQGEA